VPHKPVSHANRAEIRVCLQQSYPPLGVSIGCNGQVVLHVQLVVELHDISVTSSWCLIRVHCALRGRSMFWCVHDICSFRFLKGLARNVPIRGSLTSTYQPAGQLQARASSRNCRGKPRLYRARESPDKICDDQRQSPSTNNSMSSDGVRRSDFSSLLVSLLNGSFSHNGDILVTWGRVSTTKSKELLSCR